MTLLGTKFLVALLSLGAATWVTLAGKMDVNFLGCITVIVGGFFGANGYITGKAIKNGVTPEPGQ